jgi:hypothetical protein
MSSFSGFTFPYIEVNKTTPKTTKTNNLKKVKFRSFFI